MDLSVTSAAALLIDDSTSNRRHFPLWFTADRTSKIILDMKKISICTVCGNRLPYLRETLRVNIAENSEFPNLEYVVLNYNSKDGMDEWMMANMKKHIDSGLLKYYKTNEPEYFDLSHSKNMATRLATGDIICNIDADNFVGRGYLRWVEECFNRHGPDTLITTIHKDDIPYQDMGGKLGFTKALFHAVNGYDESLFSYGMEDVDLANRLEIAGARRVFIEDEKFLRFIGHSDFERVVNHKYPNNLKRIYACESEPTKATQKVLYLFHDHSASEMHYKFNEANKDNIVTTYFGWTVDRNGHRKASFHEGLNTLKLTFIDREVVSYRMEAGMLNPLSAAGDGLVWREINTQDDLYLRFLMGYSECLNRLTYKENEQSGVAVNRGGWGCGTVYLNFNTRDALSVC